MKFYVPADADLPAGDEQKHAPGFTFSVSTLTAEREGASLSVLLAVQRQTLQLFVKMTNYKFIFLIYVVSQASV